MSANIKWPLYGLALFVILFAAYQIGYALVTAQNTGILEVHSPSTNAQLSISQDNHQAAFIGAGSARVRLPAGSYRLSAIEAGNKTGSVVVVYKKQLTTTTLQFINSAESANSSSLFSKLPYQGLAATYELYMTPQATDNGAVSVIVIGASTPQARQAALQWIRSGGYDPSDYKIEFQNQAILSHNNTGGIAQ